MPQFDAFSSALSHTGYQPSINPRSALASAQLSQPNNPFAFAVPGEFEMVQPQPQQITLPNGETGFAQWLTSQGVIGDEALVEDAPPTHAESKPKNPNPNNPAPPPGPENPTFPSQGDMSQEGISSIFAKYEGQELTPDVLQQIANDILAINLGLEAGQLDYKNHFLEYLEQQLDLNSQQLDLARQQLEFQQGPYWDWYTTEYFEFQKQQAQNEMDMSNNQLAMSENQVEISGNDVLRSEEFTRQARAQTVGAYYQSLIPQYQLALAMAENPRGVPFVPRPQGGAPGY